MVEVKKFGIGNCDEVNSGDKGDSEIADENPEDNKCRAGNCFFFFLRCVFPEANYGNGLI